MPVTSSLIPTLCHTCSLALAQLAALCSVTTLPSGSSFHQLSLFAHPLYCSQISLFTRSSLLTIITTLLCALHCMLYTQHSIHYTLCTLHSTCPHTLHSVLHDNLAFRNSLFSFVQLEPFATPLSLIVDQSAHPSLLALSSVSQLCTSGS